MDCKQTAADIVTLVIILGPKPAGRMLKIIMDCDIAHRQPGYAFRFTNRLKLFNSFALANRKFRSD